MSVNSNEIDNRERDLELEDRDGRRGRRVRPIPAGPAARPAPSSRTAEELASLRQRIAQARILAPTGPVGCRDCWEHGRDAVRACLASPEPGDGAEDQLQALRAGLKAARTLKPPAGQLHWLDSWTAGRDAAVGALEGR
jgi:hypothetical protein